MPDLCQQLRVGFVTEIAQRGICAGAPAQLHGFGGQQRVTDTAAEHGDVGNDSFHKAVMGAAQHFAVGWLVHAAGGILLGINQRAALHTIYQQKAFAQQHTGDDGIHGSFGGNFGECDESADKIFHPGNGADVLRHQRQPDGTHPLQNGILTESVYHPDPRLSAADEIIPGHNIAVAPDTQQRIHALNVFRIMCRQSFHASPPR